MLVDLFKYFSLAYIAVQTGDDGENDYGLEDLADFMDYVVADETTSTSTPSTRDPQPQRTVLIDEEVPHKRQRTAGTASSLSSARISGHTDGGPATVVGENASNLADDDEGEVIWPYIRAAHH